MPIPSTVLDFHFCACIITIHGLKEAVDSIQIDVSQAHFWDVSAVDTLDKLVMRLQREGIDVKVVGLNNASRTLIDRFSVHDRRDIGLLD